MRLCLILLNEGVFRRRLGDGAGCGARAQVSHTWTREYSGVGFRLMEVRSWPFTSGCYRLLPAGCSITVVPDVARTGLPISHLR